MDTHAFKEQQQIIRSGRTFTMLKKILKSKYSLYLISTFGFFLLWDLVVILGLVGEFTPRPIEVAKQISVMLSEPLAGKLLWVHVWVSVRRVFIGFAIAVCIGIPIGLLMGVSKYFNAIITPVFELLKPMPPIAWISLAILWFGIGETSKIAIIVIGGVIPCIINACNGVRMIDPILYEAARTLGANRYQEMLEVTLPAAFPSIFAGMQISLSVAWTAVVAAEMIAAREGLGFIIILGMNIISPATIVSGMVIIAAIAWLISVAVGYLERWVCPWKMDLK